MGREGKTERRREDLRLPIDPGGCQRQEAIPRKSHL